MIRAGSPVVDAVVVSYNSSRTLRRCAETLLASPAVRVHVVDNASRDGSVETIADLPLQVLQQEGNRGFAHGCNVGWRSGEAPYVLFLNPDASIDPDSIAAMVDVLEQSDEVGICAPRILNGDGALEFSQRRFPRLTSTLAQALFVHRLFPKASWTDELIRDRDAYERPGSPPWVSGACMLARRTLLEKLSGLDETFFLYGEDVDICRRTRDLGYDVHFEPAATATHIGGVSAPRPNLLPVLTASRIRYARKHDAHLAAGLERVAIALGELTHTLVSQGGAPERRGHARALRVALAARDIDDPMVVAGFAARR